MSATHEITDRQAKNRDEERKQLLRETKVQIGSPLKNGAILLAEKPPVYPDSTTCTVSVVLAACGGYQPFVVWRRLRAFSDRGQQGTEKGVVDYCDLGHYYRTLGEALADFEDRR